MNFLEFLSLFIFVLIFRVSGKVAEYKSYRDYKLYLVEAGAERVRDLVENLRGVNEDLFFEGNRTATQILVSPDFMPIFEEITRHNHLNAKLLVDDYSQIIYKEKWRPERAAKFSWTAYYDVDDIYNYLENVSQTYPESTQLIVGGMSYEGREIRGLRINTARQRLDKPVIFIESGIHAREWITPATTTYFINELMTSSDPEIQAMRDDFDWRIFPSVNPDGYHYSFTVDRMWRKTRSNSPNGCRGADPNRNWDYNWLKFGASSDPCDYQTFGGAKPFSEVETRTLSEYISSLDNLQAYIAFHADAQMLLVPYADDEGHFDNYDDLIQIGKTSLDYGYKVNGAKYDGPATAAEILYKASGGSSDWVRYKLGTPIAYTYELRGVYFHWPPNRIPEQGDEVTQMMLGLVTEAKNLGYF